QQQMDEGDKRMLHAWDVATGKQQPRRAFAAEEPWAGHSKFSPDGRLLALTTGSVCDVATDKELFRLSVEGKHVGIPVAFSRDGALLALGVWQPPGSPEGHMVAVQVWELATRQP